MFCHNVFRAKNRGFTLVEIFLTISLISIVLAISAPVYSQFLKRNDLTLSSEAVLGSLRRAYTLSVSGDSDSAFGVHIDTTGVILFLGTDFSGRDESYDEIHLFAPNITVSGLGEIIFEKQTGLPSVDGAITITDDATNSRTITINEEGTVYLQ